MNGLKSVLVPQKGDRDFDVLDHEFGCTEFILFLNATI